MAERCGGGRCILDRIRWKTKNHKLLSRNHEKSSIFMKCHRKTKKIHETSFFARDQRAFKLVPKSIKEEERKGEGERGRERERKEKEHGKRKIRIGGKNIERRT